MAQGLCSNSECKIILTVENTIPSCVKNGSGYCKRCSSVLRKIKYKESSEKQKETAANYRKRNPEKVRESRKAHYRRNQKYYRARAKAVDRTPKGRHECLRNVLKKDNIPAHDLLWSLNFYKGIIRDEECHYCLGPMSPTGHGLDRLFNSFGHRCFNVVPCCRECNRIKGHLWGYEHMMLLAPKLRKLREERGGFRVGASLSDVLA
jgi:hypothetical protein